jgi:hypothetical protein
LKPFGRQAGRFLFSGWKIRGKDKERKQNNERQNDAFTQKPSRSGSIILPSTLKDELSVHAAAASVDFPVSFWAMID